MFHDGLLHIRDLCLCSSIRWRSSGEVEFLAGEEVQGGIGRRRKRRAGCWDLLRRGRGLGLLIKHGFDGVRLGRVGWACDGSSRRCWGPLRGYGCESRCAGLLSIQVKRQRVSSLKLRVCTERRAERLTAVLLGRGVGAFAGPSSLASSSSSLWWSDGSSSSSSPPDSFDISSSRPSSSSSSSIEVSASWVLSSVLRAGVAPML